MSYADVLRGEGFILEIVKLNENCKYLEKRRWKIFARSKMSNKDARRINNLSITIRKNRRTERASQMSLELPSTTGNKSFNARLKCLWSFLRPPGTKVSKLQEEKPIYKKICCWFST
ncbi:hypothetical protein TNCT_604421 [Trichonephila clavata]|uniref:Uncharacterized protein n=1 Tax=Trichonephila clavata TaxID=2740835 RepID=A0A8X6K692_TRICU|nr:hypothetical protein TNCT_604421 [Trichonephila clavata]